MKKFQKVEKKLFIRPAFGDICFVVIIEQREWWVELLIAFAAVLQAFIISLNKYQLEVFKIIIDL